MNIGPDELEESYKTIYNIGFQAGYEKCLEDVEPHAPEFVKDVYECWSKG